MGYTRDPEDLEPIADRIRQLASSLFDLSETLSWVEDGWKTPYTNEIIKHGNTLHDAQQALHDLAERIDTEADAGTARFEWEADAPTPAEG